MSETIFGDRLHQARMLRQRKQADLAETLDCSVPTLSKWEHARTVELTARQLSLACENLRFSPSFFSARPSPPLADNDLLFKAPKGMLKRESAWLREFVRLLSELVDWLDDQRQLPPVKLPIVSRDFTDIPEAARELRAALGLQLTTPIEYLTHAAERAGVVVVVRRRGRADGDPWSSHADDPVLDEDPDINERHEGCSTWTGEFRERPLVLMRGVTEWEKTRWVLAHELAHLSLHAGRMPVSDEAEEQASRFANEILAPIQEVIKGLPRVVTLATLLELKLKWGISLVALIRHLYDNGAISDQRKAMLYRQLYTRKNPETGRSYGATEPGWDSHDPERPALISAWIRHITGTLIPEAVSMRNPKFPADLLTSILNEQRGAGDIKTGGTHKNGSADVISLSGRLSNREQQERQARLFLMHSDSAKRGTPTGSCLAVVAFLVCRSLVCVDKVGDAWRGPVWRKLAREIAKPCIRASRVRASRDHGHTSRYFCGMVYFA
jgi:Zn-dependent peptidase ImmA (M78 family)/transcriptional regulator with XRE-family HTH domain